MKLYCRDFWQVADRTDNSLMLVAQEVQDFAVKVEWQEGGFPASREEQARERQAWLGARFPGVERLPEGEVAGESAHLFAWVEVSDNERRESLQWQWVRGGALLRLTATAPPLVWDEHGEQVFALFVPPSPGGTGDAGRGTRDGEEGQPSSFPLQIEGSTGGGTPEGEAEEPMVVPSIVRQVLPNAHPGRQGGAALPKSAALAEGRLNVRYSDFWRVADSGTSYVVLAAADVPELSVWFEWRPAEGSETLEAIATRRLERLREQYDPVERLPDRTIAGVPAIQFAWVGSGPVRALPPDGGTTNATETLQVEWLQEGLRLRATATATPQLWQEQGEQVLRVLEGVGK
jgi:hypothetical protein